MDRIYTKLKNRRITDVMISRGASSQGPYRDFSLRQVSLVLNTGEVVTFSCHELGDKLRVRASKEGDISEV